MRKSALWVCPFVFVFLAQPGCAQQVTFVSPTDGSTHYLGSTLQVRVDCQDPSQVRKVDLYLDGALLGTNTAAPYRWTLNTGNTAQWRTLRAVADYRTVGAVDALIQINVAGTSPPPLPTAITYVGVDKDVTDFQNGVDYGNAGYWFPQFDASGPRSGKPTQENERNALPTWAGPMTHMELWQLWKFPRRTFSQDGPCKSKGGWPSWNRFTLPNGDVGLSGIILDPHGAANTSNSVNRIMLGSGTPSSFYLRIVVDNTDLRHNPISRIRARGDTNGTSIEPATFPSPGMSEFNGIADVYTFRYDGFSDGDFIKIQFNGMPGGTNNGGTGGSSFAGLLFDLVPGTAPAPTPTPTPQPAPSSTAPGATATPSGSGPSFSGSSGASGASTSGASTSGASSGAGSSGGGSSGGGCALSPRQDPPTAALLLLLLAGLFARAVPRASGIRGPAPSA